MTRRSRRRALLGASSTYGACTLAVPTALIAHGHFARAMTLAAAFSGVLLVYAVLRSRELGRQRAQLASMLVLAGPVGPVLLARRTRQLQPVLLVRPYSDPRPL